MELKITQKEFESCFPSAINSKKIYVDSYNCEARFYMGCWNFVLFINCTESAIHTNDVWYTARLYIQGNQKFELNYGFSNYLNRYDYILKAISLDLESYVKTGNFSEYVRGYHNTFTPENLQKLNTI